MERSADLSPQYCAAIEGTALFDLSEYGKVELSGPDARIFLHNLCTQDVKHLPVGMGCEAFLTTNKARVIAHFWVGNFQTDSGTVLWLDMVAGQAEKVLQHLNHYLISEQVELADRTRELALLRLVGPGACGLLSKIAGAEIAGAEIAGLKAMQHLRVPGLGQVRRQSLLALDGFDLFCSSTEAVSNRQRLVEAGAVPAGARTHQILRVEAGLPEYGSDIDENRLAMETGRTAQAISYAKGCYLGQETIVMARDRGQVNRLLSGVKLAQGVPLPPGTKLFRASEEVGQTTSSVHSPRLSQAIALAYLRRGNLDPGTELVIDPNSAGRGAIVCALPFCSGTASVE